MKPTSTNTVYLVGAGCGTADLLTRRAAALIAAADVIVCDALVDQSIVALFPSMAEVIFVGKRAHEPSAKQEDINQLLIEKAREQSVVVRLKGGDPFVFGRGGEEALALAEAGIATEVVPGVSSALAVPACAGIPLTHREVARSFHVVTAHGADGPCEMRAYASLPGTLVILMGFSRLREIVRELRTYGRPAATPVAVIAHGATPRQRVVRGTLATIVDLVNAAHLEAPAVIVVGETAAFDLTSAPHAVRPLAGLRVGIVGTDAFAHKLATHLQAEGAAPTHLCRLKVVPSAWELPDFSRATWLVLTSANGVRVLFEKLRATKTDVRALPPKIAVIGPGTAEALAEHGLYPTLIPETYDAASLGAALAREAAPNEHILILRAAQGSAALTDPLKAAGCSFENIVTYDVVPDGVPAPSAPAVDVLVFASASGVRAFTATPSATTRIIAIGPQTANALREKGFTPCIVASESSVKGLMATLRTI